MKKRLVILMSAVLAVTSCGTAAQYASSGQRYTDGIYTRAEPKVDRERDAAAEKEIDDLVARTQETELLLFGEGKDTLVIPEDKSAVIKFSGTGNTTVTITDDPFTEVYYTAYPTVFAGWAWNPWYWGSWWGGWYDPWYWGSWYAGPWYWGWSPAFWDPWFGNPWFWGPPRPSYPHWHHHVHHAPAPGGGPGFYYGHRGSGTSTVRSYVQRGSSGMTRGSGAAGTAGTYRRGSAAITRGSASASAGKTTGSATASAYRRGSAAASAPVKKETYTSGISSVRRSSSSKTASGAVTAGTSFRRGSAGYATGSSSFVGTSTVRSSVSSYRRPGSSSGSASGYYGISTSRSTTVVKSGLDGEGSITGIDISGLESITGEDGMTYFYRQIGPLDWFIQNLADKEPVSPDTEEYGIPYANVEVMSGIFGRYYNYNEAVNACPEGWRLPTETEWEECLETAGSQAGDAADQEDDFQSGDLMADAYFNGEKMWEFWPKVDITDETGFSAIPAGYFSAGDFHGIYERAVFWVTPDAGEEPEDQAPVKCLYMDNPEIQTFLTDKGSFRASVRCVREH